MREPKKSHRPRYGEGSFKWNEKRSLWVGRWDTGTYNANGKRHFITASGRDEDKAWQSFVAKKKDFIINGPKLPTVKAGQTVEGWCKVWLEIQEKRVRSGPFKNDQSHVQKWIIPTIGKARLEELTAAHMRKLGAAVRAKRSPTTAANVQRTFSKILTAAKADGYKIPDAVYAAERVHNAKSERAAMSKDEVQQVFDLAYATYDDAVRFFMSVIYGSRKSEVLGLTWDRITIYDDGPADALIVGEIDLSWQVQALAYKDKTRKIFHIKDDEEAIHIVDAWHFTRPKTAAGVRKLPLIAPIAAELEAWRDKCPTGKQNPWNLVFPRVRGKAEYLGYPRNKKADLAEWKQLQADAGVYKVPPSGEGDPGEFYVLHEAHHSMISMLADAKVPKHVIEALVGQVELVDDYVHGNDQLAGEAVGLLADMLPSVRRKTIAT